MDAIPGTPPTQQDALVTRYGSDAVPAAGPWSDAIGLLLGHRSVRRYLPTALPTGTPETLIAAAQSASTSSNLQTWSVVSVTDPAARATLAEIAGGQKHIEQCPLFLVWLADLSRLDRIAQAEGKVLEGLPYLEPFLVAAIDAALAAQNAVVAAELLGLSILYIGALRNDVERVAKLLALPTGAVGVFGLCVGYADPAAVPEVKPRLPQEAVLHHGTYRIGDEKAQRAAYDVQLGAFSRRNEMQADSWTERVLSRIATVRALRGRDRLKVALRNLGFPLR